MATWGEELTHWKIPWCWERLQEEKGATEDEMVGWHHRFNEHGLGRIPGDTEGQGGLTCCSPWGDRKESDTATEQQQQRFFFFFQQWFLRRLMTKRKCFIGCLAYRKHSINNTNNNKPRHLPFLKHFKLFIHKLQITVFAKILFYKVAAQSAACKTHCSFSFHMVTFHPLGIVNWIKPINLIPSCFSFHCEVSIKGLLINTVSAHVRSGEDIS